MADAAPTAAAPAAPPVSKHCWDPILDHGGVIPWCIPLDPTMKPFRMLQTTRDEHHVLHFRCCNCGTRGTRKFHSLKNAGHGKHHDVFDLLEVGALAAGPCSGAVAS